jgi:hypothetical protein
MDDQELRRRVAVLEEQAIRARQERKELQLQVNHHDSMINDVDKRIDMGFAEQRAQLQQINNRDERRLKIYKQVLWRIIVPLAVGVAAAIIAGQFI